MHRLALSLLMFPLACTSEPPAATSMDPAADGGGPSASCTTGSSHFYLLNYLNVSLPDADGHVEGFDLDGEVSDGSGSSGCGHADSTAPPPSSTRGVDNQLAALAEAFDSELDPSARLEEAVKSGQIALLLEVSGVDDLDEDDCVTIQLLRGSLSDGSTTPALGSDGYPAADQEYDYVAIASTTGRLEAGVIRTEGVAIPLQITAIDPPARLDLHDVRVEVEIDPDRVHRGVVGGSIDIDQVIEVIERERPDMADLARSVLEANADLGEDCRRLSAAFVFRGVPAVKGSPKDG